MIIPILIVCLVVLYFATLILCACWQAHKAHERAVEHTMPVEFVRFSVEALERVYYANLADMPYAWQVGRRG